jgi:OmpA-OmpF porin, OOP family
MNTKSILTLVALALWILFCQNWWCNHKDECPCNTESSTSVTESGATTANNNDIIRFNTSNLSAVLGDGWNNFSDSICNLIKGGKRVEITGLYSSKETNATKFENLGIARADTIKNMLLAKLAGNNAGRFSLRSQLDENLDGTSGPFIASNIAVLDTIATPSDKGGVVVQDSNNIIIYFPSGSSAKEASKEVDDYLLILAPRLQSNQLKAIITGHTDNKGKYESNLQLSKERADFVKSILVKDGVPDAQLTINGLADKEPVGDNNTDAGRKQNRRVTIKIQ